MPTQQEVNDAINKGKDYYNRLYQAITGPQSQQWGVVKEGPGCPIAVYNATMGYWRYPGRRDAFRGEDRGGARTNRTTKFRYFLEDRKLSSIALGWFPPSPKSYIAPWRRIPDFDDIVFDIQAEFDPNDPSKVQWRIEIVSVEHKDYLYLYLHDAVVAQNPEPGMQFKANESRQFVYDGETGPAEQVMENILGKACGGKSLTNHLKWMWWWDGQQWRIWEPGAPSDWGPGTDYPNMTNGDTYALTVDEDLIWPCYLLDKYRGQDSASLQYAPRYQRSLGRLLKELGYATEGDRVIQMFDDVTKQRYEGGAWDLYEVMFGVGADRPDHWILTERTFHEPETYWYFPDGVGYMRYRTTLSTPSLGPYYDAIASYFLPPIPFEFLYPGASCLRDMYINDRIYNLFGFATGPTWDALQAIHLMNKYGLEKKTAIEWLLDRVRWDGRGPRRCYFHPGTKSKGILLVIPGLGRDRPQYSTFALGPYAYAVVKWWELLGKPDDYKTHVDEVLDVALAIMVDNNQSCTQDGCFYRPPDQGGAYVEYAWDEENQRYYQLSWDFWPFTLADEVADIFWWISNYTYKDIVDNFLGLGVTSYEGTMGCLLALMKYKSLMGW